MEHWRRSWVRKILLSCSRSVSSSLLQPTPLRTCNPTHHSLKHKCPHARRLRIQIIMAVKTRVSKPPEAREFPQPSPAYPSLARCKMIMAMTLTSCSHSKPIIIFQLTLRESWWSESLIVHRHQSSLWETLFNCQNLDPPKLTRLKNRRKNSSPARRDCHHTRQSCISWRNGQLH